MYFMNAWDTIDSAFIAVKNVAVSDVVVPVVELDGATAKSVKAVISSLRAFFIYDSVDMPEPAAR